MSRHQWFERMLQFIEPYNVDDGGSGLEREGPMTDWAFNVVCVPRSRSFDIQKEMVMVVLRKARFFLFIGRLGFKGSSGVPDWSILHGLSMADWNINRIHRRCVACMCHSGLLAVGGRLCGLCW